MANIKNEDVLFAGIDFREEAPLVCYQIGGMKEPEYLPLDFQGIQGKGACFRKILSALRRYQKRGKMRAAIVLPELTEEEIHLYLKEAMEAGFEREQLQILSEQESLVHFTMHQTNDIWQQSVWFLDFGAEEIKAVSLSVNRRTKPVLVEVREPEYWYVGAKDGGSRDERLSEISGERLKLRPVSAVFLSGTDFNAQDYRKSREVICSRRRVFLAEQVCARGACALAKDSGKRNYLFLSDQTLLYNVQIRSSLSGKESLYTLINAGCNWYEAGCSCEMLLRDGEMLEFVFSSMMGGEPIRAGLQLTDLPERPDGASRILVEMYFAGPRQCEVKVTDLGFGEFFPSSDLFWRETFWLEDEEAKDGLGDYL